MLPQDRLQPLADVYTAAEEDHLEERLYFAVEGATAAYRGVPGLLCPGDLVLSLQLCPDARSAMGGRGQS